MTKTEYREYLQGDHWKTVRRDRIDRYPACYKCHLPRWLAAIAYDQDLHVHHRTYKNLGREGIWDLEVLCRRCHEIETFGRSDFKAPKEAECLLCKETHWNPYSDFCVACARILGHSDLYGTPALEEIGTERHPQVESMEIWQVVLRHIYRSLGYRLRNHGAIIDFLLRELAGMESDPDGIYGSF